MLRNVNGTQVQYVRILLVDVEDKCRDFMLRVDAGDSCRGLMLGTRFEG